MTASDRDRSGPSRDPGQEWPARQRPARRRIFIAVDDTPSARASTVFAARLAALSEADLAALFVEEENVHQAAGFPVGFQMTRTGRPLPAIRESLEEAYRAQARNLRALVQDIAQSAHVQWSFDVRRGRLVATVTAEATARDMVVLRAADCRAGELDASARHAVTVRGAHLLIIGTEDKALGVFAASRPRSGGRAIAPACLAVSTGSKLSEAALSEARALAERAFGEFSLRASGSYGEPSKPAGPRKPRGKRSWIRRAVRDF